MVSARPCLFADDGYEEFSPVARVQLSVLGLYLAPVFKSWKDSWLSPPQTIISLSVQTAVWLSRASGALVMLVGVQLSELGSYRPPVFMSLKRSLPPHTIICVTVHTAVCSLRPSGAFVVLVGVQLSVLGLYLAPVLTGMGLDSS